MKKVAVCFIVVLIQLSIALLFFTKHFDCSSLEEKEVKTVHNINLNKIATPVSLLFELEDTELLEKKEDDFSLNDLPSSDVVEVVTPKKDEENDSSDEIISTPLYSIDASKYHNKESMGFKVTEGNKKYDLTDEEFDVVVAVVAGEFDVNLDDALGVMSVILNRCDSPKWNGWAGSTPYTQVISKGQFEVYFAGMYKAYMPGGKYYEGNKYNIAKQAVLDGLNGIRNNNYLGFRASWVTGYSDKYIVSGGNRYGYN